MGYNARAMRALALFLLLSLTLSACADPPGAPKPRPLDPAEDAQVLTVYRKYSEHIRLEKGVINTYLTAHNNPYRVMVVVKDSQTREALTAKYGEVIDGVSVGYTVATKLRPDDDELGIEEVASEKLPQTWWEQVVYFLKTLQLRMMGGQQP